MKKIISILVLLLTISLGFSQTAIKKSSISAEGGSATVGNTTIIYSVGEVAVQEATQGNTHLSEGFIGPDILNITGVADYGELQDINVYPNPVVTDLHITFDTESNYYIYLFDINGKQLVQQSGNYQDEILVDMSSYQTGVYLLVIADRKNKQRKIVKITKAK